MNQLKTMDLITLRKTGEAGDWLKVDKLIANHLSTTNYNIAVNSTEFDNYESLAQFEYDNQLNNAMGLNSQEDGVLDTHQQKLDYLNFKIEELKKIMYNTIRKKN